MINYNTMHAYIACIYGVHCRYNSCVRFLFQRGRRGSDRRGVLDTELWDKVCQFVLFTLCCQFLWGVYFWLTLSCYLTFMCCRSVVFSGYSVSSNQKTDRHNITEILLKVALNTITAILLSQNIFRNIMHLLLCVCIV